MTNPESFLELVSFDHLFIGMSAMLFIATLLQTVPTGATVRHY